jgi:hypothetical protein
MRQSLGVPFTGVMKKKGDKDDADVTAPPWMNWPTLTFFGIKGSVRISV